MIISDDTSSYGSHGPFLADVNSRSRSLYAIADPSVVCLSVTLVHPTQPVDIFGNFFFTIRQHRNSTFLVPKFIGGGRPFPPEICVQSNPPPFKHRNFDQYRLIAP